jgi:hypothetical protein
MMESMIAMKLMAFMETMEYWNDGIHDCHDGIHGNDGEFGTMDYP